MAQQEDMTTYGMYIGLPDAENENPASYNMESFYEDVHQICDKLKHHTFVIKGRKGCGKTAFVNYINGLSIKDDLIHCTVSYPKDYELEKLLQKVEDKNEKKYEFLYQWIILVKFTELILAQSEYATATAIEALRTFWKNNSGHLTISDMILTEEERESSKGVEWNPISWLKGAFSKSKKGSYKRPDFFQLLNDLQNRVVQALKYQMFEKHSFYVMFDDLDDKFNAKSQEDCRRLVSLIETANSFNKNYLSGCSGKVVVLIREDLLPYLSGYTNNFNRTIESCSYPLIWFDVNQDNNDEKKLMLRQFINKRLALNFDRLGYDYDKEDPWNTFVNDTVCIEYGYRTAFTYILSFTQCRPRDLVYIFHKIGEQYFHLPLSPENIKKLLTVYTTVAFKELEDELVNLIKSKNNQQKFYDCIKKLFEEKDFTYKVMCNRLKSSGLNEDEFYAKIMITYDIVVPYRNDVEYPYFLYPNLKGKRSDYRYRLSPWIVGYYDNDTICAVS